MGSSTVGQLNVDADFATLDQAASGKLLRLRFEIPWTWIEPVTQGTYDWTHLDHIANAIMTRGWTAHAIVVFTPTWAGAANSLPTSAQFSSIITALVTRYHRFGLYNSQPWGIRIWEMWNEPDLSNYGAPFTGTNYTNNILSPGYTAAKAVDPNCIVSCAGTANRTTTWINAMSAAGANSYFDVAGFHDYPGGASGVNSDYNTQVSNFGSASPTHMTQPQWIDEFGVLDATGTTIASWLNTVLPVGAQSPSAPSIAFYNVREDNNTLGMASSGTSDATLTSGLTNGTPVTSLSISAGLTTSSFGTSGDPLMIFYQAGDGVAHYLYATLNGTYSGGTTVTINSVTPGYSFPTGSTVVANVNGKSQQAYGIWQRGGASKGTAGSTFASYLTSPGALTGTGAEVGASTANLMAAQTTTSTAAGVSAATASLTVTQAATGTAAGVSASSANLTAGQALTSTAAEVGAASSTLKQTSALTSTAAGTSGASASLSSANALTATAAEVSAATSTLSAQNALTSTAAETGASQATLAEKAQIGGTANAVSGASGVPSQNGQLFHTSVAAGVSGSTGNLTVVLALTSTAGSVTTATGTHTVTTVLLHSSTASAIGGSSSTLAVALMLTSVAPSVGAASGVPTVTGGATTTPILLEAQYRGVVLLVASRSLVQSAKVRSLLMTADAPRND
jgi:hypothetical protein